MISFPLVTVLVPAYNHEKYIIECLNSITAQTYPNLELILLNDGSKDKTHDLIVSQLETLKARFKNFTYLNKANEGVTRTLNKGISLAKGEYFISIASDDYLTSPDAVKILVAAIDDKEKIAVICGDMAIVDSNSKRVAWDMNRKDVAMDSEEAKFLTTTAYYTHWRKGFDGFDYLSKDFGSFQSIIIGHYMPNGCLLKKQAVLDVGGYSTDVIIEDWDLWLKLSKTYNFKFIPTVLYAYRWHGANTQVTAEKRIRRDILRLVIQQKEYCFSHDMGSVWQSAFRLARSGMAGNYDFHYLSKACKDIGEKVFIDNLILMMFHHIKRIIRLIVPEIYYNKLKIFVRRLLKPSIKN